MPRSDKSKGGTAECSFCGKAQHRVGKLIAGPGCVYICDECIDLCNEIIAELDAASAHHEATSSARGEDKAISASELADEFGLPVETAAAILARVKPTPLEI